MKDPEKALSDLQKSRKGGFTLIEFVVLIAMAALIVGVIWLIPIATIWAVNTLFGLTIPYTLKTWAATLILTGIFGRQGGISRSKD